MGPPVRRLLPYIQRYRGQFVLGLVCVLITTAVQQTAPWVLGHAIDDLTWSVSRTKLIFYALVLLGIAIVSGIFLFLQRRILIGASRDIEYDIRNDFYAQLQKLPLPYFQAHRTGDLMSRATADLNAVRMMIGPSVMYLSSTIITLIVALTLMLSIDARLTLIALLPLPMVSISVKVFGSAIHRRFEKIQAQLSDLSAVVQESLSGVRVVRAYRQEMPEIERFRTSNQEYFDRNRGLILLQGFFFPSMTFFLGLGALLVLWLGSVAVIKGQMRVGEFVAFMSYMAMLSWPMIAFGWVTNMLQRGMASWKRMLEVFEAVPAIADPADPAPAPREVAEVRGEIEFRNLTFHFNGRPVLSDVSLRIPAGTTAAFVGLTGSGKSTLLSLLPRLYDPPPGTVFLDGIDIRQIPLAVLRGAIGLVPQEPFLFSDTLASNIAFGADVGGPLPDRDAQVRHAAAVARLDKDVAEFPRGYETMVGERGLTLSGGQKQRTALARAIMIDPKVLILDDALSAVDTYTEEEILSRLREVMRQRTSIIVAHRISTVREADRIFVLADGRIIEEGTHDELVQMNGQYADLHQKQLLEEELAAS